MIREIYIVAFSLHAESLQGRRTIDEQRIRRIRQAIFLSPPERPFRFSSKEPNNQWAAMHEADSLNRRTVRQSLGTA
jgi:hypothetical protein